MLISIASKRNLLALLAIFLIGFFFRLLITLTGFHVDILSIAAWGQWIFKHGIQGFYESEGWILSSPTQPPLVNLLYGFDAWFYFQSLEFFRYASSYIVPHLAPGHMLWWFQFVIWFDQARYPDSTVPLGYLAIIKLGPILADMVIALIIYFLARKYSFKRAIIFSLLYLVSPFSWYLSALWGQYDQIGFLFLLVSFILLLRKNSNKNLNLYLSPLIFAISAGLKPTTLVFIPLYLFWYIYSKPKLAQIIFGIVSVAAILFVTTAVFTNENIFTFIREQLIPKIFFKSEFRVSTNSFNFWHILIGDKALDQDTIFLFLPAKIWGYLSVVIINILAFKISIGRNPQRLFAAMFLVGAGVWLFMTNMLERYFFAGVVSLLLLSIYKPSLLKYWLVISLIYWVNLFNGWWFPTQLAFLQDLLTYRDGIVTRLLSIINVLVYLRVIWLIFKAKSFDNKNNEKV